MADQQPTTSNPSDPFSAFGGVATESTGAAVTPPATGTSQPDPFAAFGGIATEPASTGVTETQGPSAEEQTFLQANPHYQYLPADEKFPNRPAGIYPSGPGSEWRTKDAMMEQHPVDLHFARHTAEGAASGAAVATLPITAGAALETVPAVAENMLQMSERTLQHFAENYPMLAKLGEKLGYGAGVTAAYKIFKKLGF
jgi:hypothetical protein